VGRRFELPDRLSKYQPLVPPSDAPVRPLWSVMIPTYNCAALLEQTLQSVLDQAPGAELMHIEVVDDASTTDDPEAVVNSIGGGRVEFHRQPENQGHSRNFNTCLQRSRGRLVHLLHGDDWVGPDFYRTMGALFERFPAIGAGFCRHTITNPDGSAQRMSPLEQEEAGVLDNWLDTIAGELRLQPPSMIVRRTVYEALGAFDTRMKSCGEDWEMWVRIAANYPVGYEPTPQAFYRDNAQSLTKRSIQSGQNMKDVRKATSITASYLRSGTAAAANRRARRNWAGWGLHWAWSLACAGDYRAALVQLREALLCDRSPQTLRRSASTAKLVFRGLLSSRRAAA